jgi:hypothetical protein
VTREAQRQTMESWKALRALVAYVESLSQRGCVLGILLWADRGSLGKALCAARCSETLAAALVQRSKPRRYHFLECSSIPTPDTMRTFKSCCMAHASALEEYIYAQYLQRGS